MNIVQAQMLEAVQVQAAFDAVFWMGFGLGLFASFLVVFSVMWFGDWLVERYGARLLAFARRRVRR